MQYTIEAKETLAWLQAEKQYYDQLLSKLDEQEQAIDDEDETGLLIIVADKNRLIEEIAEIDRKIGRESCPVFRIEPEKNCRKPLIFARQMKTFTLIKLDSISINPRSNKSCRMRHQKK